MVLLRLMDTTGSTQPTRSIDVAGRPPSDAYLGYEQIQRLTRKSESQPDNSGNDGRGFAPVRVGLCLWPGGTESAHVRFEPTTSSAARPDQAPTRGHVLH